MQLIAWTFTIIAAFMLLISVAGESWLGALLALGALLLILPPLWNKLERPQISSGARGALATALLVIALGVTMFTVNNSPEGKAVAARDKRLGRHCLASDGSPEKLVSTLKSLMGNPDSFDHLQTSIEPVDSAGQHRVSMRYRAENRFGGMSLEAVEATLDSDDCTPTSIS